MAASKLPWKRGGTALLGGLIAVTVTLTGQSATAAPTERPSQVAMDDAFSQAAAEFNVPRALLVAVGYGETHLDGHAGKPSQAGGYGVMHLVSNPEQHTLQQAAQLTGESVADLKKESAANIRGGAALLSAYADELELKPSQRADLDQWYQVVARYSGASDARLARLYADTVYRTVSEGVRAGVEGGESVVSAARRVRPERGEYARVTPLDGPVGSGARSGAGTRSDDYPPAHWVPADSGNYASGRTAAIDTVVIHVTQGSYAGTISWFQNPDAEVSAHYVVRSSDGDITQMVRDADTAWHARSANPHSLGIEHEGYVDDPSWFTDTMYRSSAALTKHLCDTYGIPKDRDHIVGHVEVPGNDHTDPGPHWDWDAYMGYVTG